MKIREVFEYEVDTDDVNEIFFIKDYVDCVDDMCTPFWDGYANPHITNHSCVKIDNGVETKIEFI